MTIIYRQPDGDERLIHTKTIAIVGYNDLARYLCGWLRHHPVRLLVTGTQADQTNAQADGWHIEIPAVAVQQADIMFLSVADEDVSETYMTQVARGLRKGQMLIFRSAYAIAFGFIEPPPFIDVGLLAPRSRPPVPDGVSPAKGIRSFIGVGQDASRSAWEQLLGFAKAVGMLDEGALEVSFEQEAEMSLFVEQAIIPAFHKIIINATELFIRQGYPIEGILTDFYLSGKFSDYIQQSSQIGLFGALATAQKTTQYGTLTRRERFNELKLERLLETILNDIRSGNFSKEWAKEYAEGHPRLDKLQKAQESLDLWDLEQQTIDLFSDNH